MGSEMNSDSPTLIGFYDEDCRACDEMRALLQEVVFQNRSTGLGVVGIDVWASPELAVEHAIVAHPVVILYTNRRERVRMTGHVTKRRLLRKVLPYLYADFDEAQRQLRRQLESPGEHLPQPKMRAPLLPRRDDQAEALSQLPLFSALTKRQLRLVARYCDEVVVESGTPLCVEGETGDELFLILKGAVVVARNHTNVARLGPGDFFGEISVIDQQPRTATVTADRECVLLVMHRREFWYVLEELPGVCERVIGTLSHRLRALEPRPHH